ncbi:hypothetical protein [Kordiimonas sp. SCSIO 12610]|uniref:hypothetical protein n=1 Tax=Kordiimonas sp. SCSIO 12610 TaxID=2829597 RepID=UPI00210902D8|nr:hypothetical protein [Kordiimonas sp. SCSIO 12610]UTW56533.1 hypothetical protein KFF44_06430 [Kordiimonas sp. SCSIO 12610]
MRQPTLAALSVQVLEILQRAPIHNVRHSRQNNKASYQYDEARNNEYTGGLHTFVAYPDRTTTLTDYHRQYFIALCPDLPDVGGFEIISAA